MISANVANRRQLENNQQQFLCDNMGFSLINLHEMRHSVRDKKLNKRVDHLVNIIQTRI